MNNTAFKSATEFKETYPNAYQKIEEFIDNNYDSIRLCYVCRNLTKTIHVIANKEQFDDNLETFAVYGLCKHCGKDQKLKDIVSSKFFSEETDDGNNRYLLKVRAVNNNA